MGQVDTTQNDYIAVDFPPHHADGPPTNNFHYGNDGFGSGSPHLIPQQRDVLLDNSVRLMERASVRWADVCSEDTDEAPYVEQEVGEICLKAIVLVD